MISDIESAQPKRLPQAPHRPSDQDGPRRSSRRVPRRPPSSRRGAALIELALSILVFLTMVLGFIDLGIGLLRYHQLTDAVRHLARQAAVHGDLATKLGPWGPATATGNAAGSDALSTTLRQRLTGIPANQVNFTVDWLDGGNDVLLDHRVRVAATFNFQPMVTFIFGSPTISLQSTTIVHIAH